MVSTVSTGPLFISSSHLYKTHTQTRTTIDGMPNRTWQVSMCYQACRLMWWLMRIVSKHPTS